ncbi:MAG TPA: hypothetical protein VK760_01260 [Candidatus Acidoferrales bacterium]|jgi:hypothetical protein|nr:hypothetical protein [Candidatus Acidoferrales bacterium]
MNPFSRWPASTARSAAAGAALFFLCGSAVSASGPSIDLTNVVAARPDGSPLTMMEKDLYAMGGDDLNHWPYIEHSSSNGDVQGINFMVPDKSRWGWRFISRITDTNVTVRAQIDVDGNATFTGNVYGRKLLVGVPGQNAAALAWGNHLSGDAMSTLFSSSTTAVDGVVAQVFGVSYAGVPVLAQDGYGNLGVEGNLTARQVSARALQANGSTISSGSGIPSTDCAVGDLHIRTDADATTLYSCTSRNTWTALGGSASASATPQFARTPFSSRAIASTSPTSLGAATMTLGTSTGARKAWYVCSIVEATTEADGNDRVAFGIAAAATGTGTAFRMYSHPRQNAKDRRFDTSVLSDWAALPNTATNGRYCNTYDNGATVAFTAYAVPASGAGANPVYTSGQIEIQATPQ